MVARSVEQRTSLDAAEVALSRCDWRAAADALAAVLTDDGSVEARRLDLLGEAYWWLGQIDDCIEARQHAFQLYERHGALRSAGHVAVWLYEHHAFKARPAMASAWLRRGRRLLADDTECVEWGRLALREAEIAHGQGDLARAVAKADAALALARRIGSTDLEAEALQTLGRVLIDNGDVVEGLAHFDDAMLLVVEGRVGPYATGKVYCSLIGACEDVGDIARAAEWTEMTSRWAEEHPFAIFPGLCRVKRAGVLQWRGQWAEAEREARQACDELSVSKVGSAGAAWCEIGEIRRRRGDLAGAQEAFEQARLHAYAPSAGMALLRLAQGDVDNARETIERALEASSWNRLSRAKLLPAKVAVALAAGDTHAALDASAELDDTARLFNTSTLRAAARTAQGRARLACDEHEAAMQALADAVAMWTEIDAPYERATAELWLGHCHAALGQPTAAARYFSAARETFDRLGAVWDDGLTGKTNKRSEAREGFPCGLTAREIEVLRLVAEGRTNKSIATALGLSQKTVARHLSNIFLKASLSSRSAATAFAYTHGLVATR